VAPSGAYGKIAHRLLHGSPAAAIAFYDPRLGAVVVASHSQEWSVGDVINITLPSSAALDQRALSDEEGSIK